MIWGRPVRPLGLALVLATAVVFVLNIADIGTLDGSSWGDLLALVGGSASVLLVVGWVGRWERVYRAGLLAAFACWVFRAALIGILRGDAVTVIGLYMSIAWAVAAGGAYLLERPTRGEHRWWPSPR